MISTSAAAALTRFLKSRIAGSPSDFSEFLGKRFFNNRTARRRNNPLVICTTILRQNPQSIQHGQVQPNSKPPIAAYPLDKEKHSMFKSQESCGTTPMSLTIASGHCIYAVKGLSRALQQPDSEDVKIQ
eukprot:584278-Amphidinium_carterae.1